MTAASDKAGEAGKVAFFSPEAAAFGVDLAACARRVVESGWFILGPAVREFEAAFAAYIGTRHAVGVASGTDALVLALRALGVEPGSRVVTVANAGYYTSTALALVGAEPLYADVDAATLTLAPAALRPLLAAGGVDAVVLTHLYGTMGEVEAIAAECAAAGVPLVEDCAQSHGAERGGRRAGSFGQLACFSFYPTKNLGAIGDGGAVLTADDALAARVRQLAQYGWQGKYHVALAGGSNSRLDELQAAVLAAKLPRLDAANASRREVAAHYGTALADLPLVLPPAAGPDAVAHLYVVRTPRRDELQRHLGGRGIATDIHYPVPDHLQPVRAGRPHPALPVTEAACRQVLSLPCYPGLPVAARERVIAAVRSFFEADGAC